MTEWLESLTPEQRAKFMEFDKHISLAMLAKFCEDEGLELPAIALDTQEILKS